MQDLEPNKENTNPDNFLNTASPASITAPYPADFSNNSFDLEENTELYSETGTVHDSTTSNSGATKPKYSFASDYTPSRHFSGLSAYPTSSFAVLNSDYIAPSPHSNKPNAIVHPIRRAEQASVPKTLNLNGFDQDLRVTGYNPSLSVTHPQLSISRHFAEELNRKLSHLSSIQENHHIKNSSHHSSNQDTLNQRPLFITTVPRGIFLPPPKDIILLSPSRKRQLYAYSSHPVVYNTTSSTLSTSCYNDTHNGHKVKDANEHKYTKRNTFAMAKDKYGNYDDGDPSAIPLSDKGFMATAATKAPSQLNGVRLAYNASTPVPGGVHISKQQFHQQLQQNRPKRENPPAEPFKNVMHDRRVVRGSNFVPNQFLEDYDPFDKTAAYRRRLALRKRNVASRNQRNVLGTPPPVMGRRHEDVQTDKYLEELVAKPTEVSTETQTDLFLEKPPTPPYIPAKIGVDVATEIEDDELFHFDAEAQPIIDVMVDSILEISILEVAHEQEVAAMRKKQQELLSERERELAELRRLEEEEIRLRGEKERRLRQDKIAKDLDEEMQKGVTAAKLLQGHISSILPDVLDNLEPATDAAKKDHLMKTVCPWLSVEVAKEVGQIVDSREILTVIIQEIIKQRAAVYAGYKEDIPVEHLDEGEEEQEQCYEICETESDPHQPTCPPDTA